MPIQKTSWGQIEWMDNKDNSFFQLGLKVGIVTMDVQSYHPPHKHYDEQVHYIIQGQAVSSINGEKVTLKSGEFCQWPMGVVHEIRNIGTTPFVHLMISNPAGIKIDQFLTETNDIFHPFSNKNQQMEYRLYQALESIRTQFLETMNYPYSIFNANGDLISRGEHFPAYCINACDPLASDAKCPCMKYEDIGQFHTEQTFLCVHGMQIFSIPLIVSKQYMGCIQGGYFWQSYTEKNENIEVYDTPDSTAISIQQMFQRIASAIQNHCEIQQYQQDLNEKAEEITNIRQSQKTLIKDLKAAEYAMTDLRINQHFLANTLNSMGKIALENQLLSLYDSIVALSKMFHYTLRTQSTMVDLSQELDYVKAYLQLQKLRFKDNLTTVYEVEPNVLQFRVPFNFLQPIVENAFKHGFHDMPDKHIKICCVQNYPYLEIRVYNSGRKIHAEELAQINQGIQSNYIHGLALINYKLKIVYGEDISMEMFTAKSGYTCVQVRIPVNPICKGESYDQSNHMR